MFGKLFGKNNDAQPASNSGDNDTVKMYTPQIPKEMGDIRVTKWLVAVGDKVRLDEVIAEVETDMATMELLSEAEGKVLAIHANEGEYVAVGGLLVEIAPSDNSEPKGSAGHGPEAVTLPQMDSKMVDATVIKWHVQLGSLVRKGDILAEVATDKATMELETYADGTVLHIAAKQGEKIPVGGLLLVIGNRGDDISHLVGEGAGVLVAGEAQHAEIPRLTGIVGEVRLYAGEQCPEGWLWCDGLAYKHNEKPALYSTVGHRFGGEGELFCVPSIEPIGGVRYIICESE